jgi:hypothetical protein
LKVIALRAGPFLRHHELGCLTLPRFSKDEQHGHRTKFTRP